MPELEQEAAEETQIFEEIAALDLTDEPDDEPVEGEEDAEPSAPASPAEPPAEPPAAPAPPSTPEPEGAPPPAAVAPAPPPPEPVAPPPAPTPAPAPAPAEPTREELVAQRQQIATEIASRYSFTEEEQEQLQTEPHKVLPWMVGKLYLDVFDGVMGAVMAQVPQLIAYERNLTAERTKNEDRFYTRWPALKGADERKVASLVTAYRQANPQASLDQIIEHTGAMAHVAMGIPLAPAASTPPPAPSPSRPPIPAAPGASSGPAPAPRQRTIWEELADVD